MIGSHDWTVFTPFTHEKIWLKCWGLPRKRVSYVRGLPWERVGNVGSRNYFESDLLRPWNKCVGIYICTSQRSLVVTVSHVYMSHATHVHGSCHVYEWVMAHIRVISRTASCRAKRRHCKYSMNHVAHANESMNAYIWMRRVTHMIESYHTYNRVMSHIWMSHDLHSFMHKGIVAYTQ